MEFKVRCEGKRDLSDLNNLAFSFLSFFLSYWKLYDFQHDDYR